MDARGRKDVTANATTHVYSSLYWQKMKPKLVNEKCTCTWTVTKAVFDSLSIVHEM